MNLGRNAVSTESRLSRFDLLKVTTGILLLGWLIRLLVRTYRVEVEAGAERFEQLRQGSTPVVIAGWHEGLLASGTFLLDGLVSRGFPLALLVSLSRDGEILARLARKLGMEVVRGSTSRGGLGGLRRLYRKLSRGGFSVGIAPDGPRGPAHECKPGVLLLAQIAGVPVLPIASAASSAWRLGSWDRMIVPHPFARVAIVLGQPIGVPASLSSEELASASQELAETLNDLSERARLAVNSRYR